MKQNHGASGSAVPQRQAAGYDLDTFGHLFDNYGMAEMGFSSEEINKDMTEAWRNYVRQVESFLSKIEKEIQEATREGTQLTEEWLRYVEEVMDEINNCIFSIGEPKWADSEDAALIRDLKKRIYEFGHWFHQIRF